MIAMQGMEINYTSITGNEPERAGRGHQFLHGVWGAFPTSDGHICIAGVDEKRWPSFCKIVGIQHLEKDPDYSDNVIRNFHGDKIQKVLDEIFPRKSSREWLKELTDADILATEVVDYRSMLKSEQARVNGYLLELDHPVAGKVLVSGTPVTINGEVTTAAQLPPEHGQHTEEVLLELGYTWEEIGALRDSGAV
jgi:crotonobetainyl-CoA:carnitine CoA-transferase CaiB-like acyl-CoA transferase